jgi:glycosyltransferase involved in cell wall biosynthesis
MRLSIITINYNNVAGLRQTIESVVSQKGQDFEYIIIDGGSTDGSVDVIKKYTNKIDYWVSEPDSGIYNAMNKGTRAANGDFCLFLNSGDWLFDATVVENIIPYLDGKFEIVEGFTWLVSIDKIRRHNSGHPVSLSVPYFVSYSLSHPSSFIKRKLLLERPYKEDFKIVSDWIFFFESFLFDHVCYKPVDVNTTYFDTTGISSNMEHSSLHEKERKDFINSIRSDIFASEIEFIPYDVYDIYSKLRYSFSFKWILTKIIRLSVGGIFF